MFDLTLVQVPASAVETLMTSAPAVYETMQTADRDHRLEMGDVWPAVHFILTGEYPMPRTDAYLYGVEWNDDSLENALMGGADTPACNLVVCVRLLTPAQVVHQAQLLHDVSLAQFDSRCDLPELRDHNVIPESWDGEGDIGAWLAPYFIGLRDFYAAAAASQAAVLSSLHSSR